jgi:hypothetical protein
MINTRVWSVILVIIGIVAIAMPAISIFSKLGWYKENWIALATFIVLAITAWGLIVYAGDVRRQTNSLTKVAIFPSLAQDCGIYAPGRLRTGTLFSVSNPSGKSLNVYVKLKIWVGSERVHYSGGGLYDGTEAWVMSQGQFRGAVDPGVDLEAMLTQKVGGNVIIPDFLDMDNTNLAQQFQQLNIAERIRARLFVRYPSNAGEVRDETESASYMYFLQLTDETPPPAAGQLTGRILSLSWIPDPMESRIPSDGRKFSD